MRDLEGNSDARPELVVGKTIRPELATDSERVEQFERECYTWLSLAGYKHIVRLFSVDRFYRQAFAIGEYVPPVLLPNTLRGWLDDNLIELEAALRFGVQICRAITYARSRGLLVHQDLKPDNVMITGDGVVKVTDWGLSRLAAPEHGGLPSVGDVPYRYADGTQTEPTAIHGTRGYAAPELSRPGAEPSPEVDMFSLGVTLVEMFAGTRPEPDKPPTEVAPLLAPLSPAVASELAGLLAACLSSRCDARPDSTAGLQGVMSAAFQELVGAPIEKPPAIAQETLADAEQRSYGLFMLGRIDEAMEIQTKVVDAIQSNRPEGAREATEAPGEPQSPAIVVDYKEAGWKFIVPEEHLAQAEEQLRSAPDNLDYLGRAITVNQIAGNVERALELCRLWLEHRPDDVEKLDLASELLAQQGNWTEALEHLDRAIAREPDDASLWLNRARRCEESRDPLGALHSAEHAVSLEPRNVQARIHYGHLLREHGEHESALRQFEAAIEVDPQSALSWYNLGTTARGLGWRGMALKGLQKAVEIDPDFALALNTLGGLVLELHATQEAVAYFERAIAADPHYARPWFNLGQVYTDLEHREKAREAYENAVGIDPHYALARDALRELTASRGW